MALKILDLGAMSYEECTDIQRSVLESVISGNEPHTLIFVEHEPVLTLGSDFHEANLLQPSESYAGEGIRLIRTDRGGDVTYHGPGQLVIYPIFDLNELGRDLHRWLRDLEDTMIMSLNTFGLEGQRLSVNTGVWVDKNKIAAIGIKVRKWVSMHGIALNCNTDLSPYQKIIPCGVLGHGVTSLSQELGRDVSTQEAKPAVLTAFHEVFGGRGRF